MAGKGSRLRTFTRVVLSLVLLSAFLVATPLGQTAGARRCGPRSCHPRIYCDDAGVSIEGTDASETVYGTSGDDIILAKGGDDVIYGGEGNDVICGGEGKDTIFGEDGDDIIYPNKGNDIVDGGAGADAIAYNDDTADLTAATATPIQFGVSLTDAYGLGKKDSFAVVVDLEAIDVAAMRVCAPSAKLPDGSSATVGGCAINDGYGGHDQILADASGMSSIEDVTGSFFPLAGANQPLVNGLYLRNYLVGDSADNYLAGSGGADVLAGGGGQDTADYWLDNPGVSVDLSSPCASTLGGCGTDGRGSEDSLLGIEDVNGTRYDDHLIGDAGANVLDGGSTYSAAYNGNDVISGGGGDDTLLGGTGTNTLDGGSGTDLASYSNEPGLGGIDFDMSVIGPKSPGFSTDDMTSVEGVIGTPSADTLKGDGTANVLSGAGGNDTLAGRAGGDTLIGGDGTDTTDYSNDPGPVSGSLGLGKVTDGSGSSDAVSQLENFTGSAFDDELTGDRGPNILDGRDGADICNVRIEDNPVVDDTAVNCEATLAIHPALPTNLSTEQTGLSPVLHASFFVADGGSGRVQYTLYDGPDLETANKIFRGSGPTVTIDGNEGGGSGGGGNTSGSAGLDSPLSLDGTPLVEGQTYYWSAMSSDGSGVSEWSALQPFVFTPKRPICPPSSHQFFVQRDNTNPPNFVHGTWNTFEVRDRDLDPSCDGPSATSTAHIERSGYGTRGRFIYVEIGYTEYLDASDTKHWSPFTESKGIGGPDSDMFDLREDISLKPGRDYEWRCSGFKQTDGSVIWHLQYRELGAGKWITLAQYGPTTLLDRGIPEGEVDAFGSGTGASDHQYGLQWRNDKGQWSDWEGNTCDAAVNPGKWGFFSDSKTAYSIKRQDNPQCPNDLPR